MTFIDFYKSKKELDVAPPLYQKLCLLIYADKSLFEYSETRSHNYYLNGNINRDVYFVLRNKNAHNIDTSILTYIRQNKQQYG